MVFTHRLIESAQRAVKRILLLASYALVIIYQFLPSQSQTMVIKQVGCLCASGKKNFETCNFALLHIHWHCTNINLRSAVAKHLLQMSAHVRSTSEIASLKLFISQCADSDLSDLFTKMLYLVKSTRILHRTDPRGFNPRYPHCIVYCKWMNYLYENCRFVYFPCSVIFVSWNSNRRFTWL